MSARARASQTAEGQGEGSLEPYASELLQLADDAIDHGLAHGEPPALDPSHLAAPLQAERASFVTLLDRAGGLRGCIGSIEARRPLAADVSANAFAAAFQDPRFPPLTGAERPTIHAKLSVLTPLEPMTFTDEADLVRQLVPGVDGVLIEAGRRRGTLLPQVWDDIPQPGEFWLTLKRKAGLGLDEWTPELKAYRYRTESIG